MLLSPLHTPSHQAIVFRWHPAYSNHPAPTARLLLTTATKLAQWSLRSPQPSTTGPALPPASSVPVYTIPVHNKFAALSESPQRSVSTSVQIPVHVSDQAGPHQSPRSSVSLADTKAEDSTDYLIIGDSVLTLMRADKMNTGDYVSLQKISIPGLTAFQVAQWLQTLTPNPKVSRLVIHVGVNDCKGGEIYTEQWSSLLSLSRSRFPSATVITFSIIPAWGRHPMNPAITKSNHDLKSACRKQHVTCVDHHDTFAAKSQAPKKAWYDNALYPSRQGLLKLDRNIKYPNANLGKSQGNEERNPRPCPPPPTLLAMLPSHLCHPGPSQPRAVSPSVQTAKHINVLAVCVLSRLVPLWARAECKEALVCLSTTLGNKEFVLSCLYIVASVCSDCSDQQQEERGVDRQET